MAMIDNGSEGDQDPRETRDGTASSKSSTTMTSGVIVTIDHEGSTSTSDGESKENSAGERLEQLLEDAGGYLEDKVHVVCFPGLSQYSMGGPSACGLIAMNCVRKVLSLESGGITGRNLLKDILRKDTVSNILSICEFWPSDEHLDLEDIQSTPLFDFSLRHICSVHGRPSLRKFEQIIRQLERLVNTSDNQRSCAVVITRPPEIIVCFKLVLIEGGKPQDLYALFDSHPRPFHPEGAAFVFSKSATETARYLAELLPFDNSLLENPTSPVSMPWQTQLLGHVSGDFFEHSGKDVRMSADAQRALMGASCALLRMKAENAQCKSQCDSLKAENKRLNDEIEFFDVQQTALSLDQPDDHRTIPRNSRDHVNGKGKGKNIDSPLLESTPGASSSGMQHTDDAPVQRPNDPRLVVGTLRSGSFDTEGNGQRTKRIHRGVGVFHSDDYDVEHALQLQRDLIEEDELLANQLDALKTTYSTFECGVCFDEMPRDSIVQMDGCTHPFCHTCASAYAKTRIGEHRYPILCPSCVSEGDKQGSGVINEALIVQLGISEEEYATFMEMQLADFSILIHCRRCQRGAFVDRTEFNETDTLECPLPNCNFSWCKNCQQEVHEGSNPPHSCDGTNELGHLIQSRGWKRCPGCQTPTEKNGGCNHMTCISPGCNTHFCYRCGQLVIRSAIRNDVQRALENHYVRCVLFNPGET